MQAERRSDTSSRPRAGWSSWLWAVGPGLMVMLADTDAGSLVTAAQSGATWGYAMLLPLALLIPVVYMIQEITVRLGLVTGQGHGALIRERFGSGWAIVSVTTLFLSGLGALVTEFTGIAGVGALVGVSPRWSVSIATALLVVLGLTGSYRRVERIGIAVGLFELLLIPAAVMAHPAPAALLRSLAAPVGDPSYQWLLAANIGAVIMPWMIFYQQSAVVDKRLALTQLRAARRDTAVGAVVTQLVMMAVVMMTAATIGLHHPHRTLDTVQEIARGLTPFLGTWGGRVAFGLGMLGASFVAALVVSLAAAWGMAEVFRLPRSLNLPVRDAPGFYAVYTLAHVGGALLVWSGLNLIRIDVDTEVMNALLLPLVLTMLLMLEARALPRRWRLSGAARGLVWGVAAVVMLFSLYVGVHLL
jgi:Mn2+/Fe2+ NRAMP family transporter